MKKIKQYVKEHSDEIVYIATMALVAGATVGGVYSMVKVYSKTFNSMMPATITNEGPKSLYQLGGPNSPLKYELTDALAEGYNRAGLALENAKKTIGGGLKIAVSGEDRAAWNYVAKMTNDFLATHGAVSADLVVNHYLNKI